MSDDVVEDDPAWMEACRREETIRDLLRSYPGRMTRRAVEDVAWELGLSRTTLYELIGRYRATGTVDVLLEPERGRPKGSLHEEPVRDALIQQFLEREYLKPTRPPLRRVVAHIATACRQQGLPAPTWRTVKARLLRIDERLRASRRGEAALVRARIATPGVYEVTRPLQVVQIDHTQVDVGNAWRLVRPVAAGARACIGPAGAPPEGTETHRQSPSCSCTGIR